MKFGRREIGTALMVAALIVLTVINLKSSSRNRHLVAENAILARKLKQAQVRFDQAAENAQQNDAIAGGTPASPIELFSWDIKALRTKGLKDPVNNIVSDLKRNAELIPYPPRVGGRMNFYDAGKIWILAGRWVFAYFEDGHNGGYMLLEYQVAAGGKIIWKVLASYLA
jgi:hypothetical protein